MIAVMQTVEMHVVLLVVRSSWVVVAVVLEYRLLEAFCFQLHMFWRVRGLWFMAVVNETKQVFTKSESNQSNEQILSDDYHGIVLCEME